MSLTGKYNQRPNHSSLDRLNKLTDKLNVKIIVKLKNSIIDPEKNSKFEFLNSRIADVNEHLKDVSDQTDKKFNIIKENVSLL